MEIYRMKKSLFALAATTAFAGAAQAQSSVTVYGILDMGYAGYNSRLVDKAGNVVKTTGSAFNQSQEQTSRLGFRGTEDLGGGASAFFTIELGLTPQTSGLSGSGTVKDTFQNTDQNSGSAVDNRQSFVGLKKNGLGQFAFGRQYTPVFNAGAATDASQYANVVGNVIYQGSAVGTAADSGLGAASLNGAFTNRANSAITAKSDNFGGFTVSGMYAMSNQNQTFNPYAVPGSANINTSAGGNTNWNGWGLGADFTWQKLYATVAYQSFSTVYSENNVYAANNINLGGGATAGQSIAGGTLFAITNLKDNQAYAALSYDFGILKAFAQYSGRKIQNNAGVASTQGQIVNRTSEQLGVRSFITPKIEAWGSVGMGNYTGAPGLQSTNATGVAPQVKFTGYQVGGNYWLSKRTNAYAIFGSQQTSGNGNSNVTGSGNQINQYAVGVRHTF